MVGSPCQAAVINRHKYLFPLSLSTCSAKSILRIVAGLRRQGTGEVDAFSM